MRQCPRMHWEIPPSSMNKVSLDAFKRRFSVFSLMCVQGVDFCCMCSSAESTDVSAQNALDLLLNMSNARELVGNGLQVGYVLPESLRSTERSM